MPKHPMNLTHQPARIAAGGIVLLTAAPPEPGTFYVEWRVEGPVHLADDVNIAILGMATLPTGPVVVPDTDSGPLPTIRATLDTSPMTPGAWHVGITLTRPVDDGEDQVWEGQTETIEVLPRPFAAGDDVAVTMKRTAVPATEDQALWAAIRNTTNALGFDNYSRFLDLVLCSDRPYNGGESIEARRLKVREGRREFDRLARHKSLPYPDIDAYRFLKVATEVFMMIHCGVESVDLDDVDLAAESRRFNRNLALGDIRRLFEEYLDSVPVADNSLETIRTIPYLGIIRLKLREVAISLDTEQDEAAAACYGILADKLTNPCFLELIWSYWHEEGMLVQAINAITWRFQNRRTPGGGRDPLAELEIDPLRPLNNLIWGYIQDEQHRLSVIRRAYEYDHHYGLTLVGKAVPGGVRPADSRSRFIEAFHNLLALVSVFYQQDDDTTVIADGFPVLNGLKETHLLLTQGAHNQYGDLPWTARQEMLMQQWLMARPEMREYLPTRIMVAYPEAWMDRVEAMKGLQGWTDTSVLHFRDLGVFGEQILLGIRFGAWTKVIEPEQAANWARYWRAEVQGYIHAYRAVTGVDLTTRADATVPAIHLQRRLSVQHSAR